MTLAWLEPAWQQLRDRLGQDRLAHALLLSGPEGIGKTRAAREMAALLLCLEPGDTACGACRSCTLLRSGAHPELTLVEPPEGKHQIPVDAVRALSAAMTLSTTISRRKVVLIAPAEAMNLNAANALLKSLEEPQGEAVMLLVSHDLSRLPVTIRSRCQAIAVQGPSPGDAAAWLQAEAQVDAERAGLALDAAGGRPLLALDLLEGESLDLFARLQSALAGLLGRPGRASAVAHGLSDAEPRLVWGWLSLSAAAALRAQYDGLYPAWLPRSSVLVPGRVAELQQRADRNRRLSGSGLRQDLLMQDWLLEWAAQADNGSQGGRAAPGE